MSEYKTKISRDDYLKALALFTVAGEHYRKAGEFAEELNRIIMAVPEKYPGGHVDDALYTDERATVIDFDEALRRDGVTVEAEAARPSTGGGG